MRNVWLGSRPADYCLDLSVQANSFRVYALQLHSPLHAVSRDRFICIEPCHVRLLLDGFRWVERRLKYPHYLVCLLDDQDHELVPIPWNGDVRYAFRVNLPRCTILTECDQA